MAQTVDLATADRFAPLERLRPVDPESWVSVIAAHRRRFLVPVRQPLVLVTQIQRSGGTLITQLFDGHSALHVHPSELHIGKPKTSWPKFDPDWPAAELFARLREQRAVEHAKHGYQKLSPAEAARNPDHRELVLPFLFLVGLQRELFEAQLAGTTTRSRRSVLDAYATAYFNAWIDYAGLYRDPAAVRAWMAFIPRFLADSSNLPAYFADYPDGRVIIPIRDPASWYASAVNHTAEYEDLEGALDLWTACNVHALAAADAAPDRVLFVRMEGLIANTKASVRRIARFLDVAPEPGLLTPTFNGMPVISDSSFGARFGIDPSALDRSGRLDASVRARIAERTGDLHRQLLARAVD